MRLLLDAQISQHTIATPLRKRGHDVLALVEHPSYDSFSDEQVLKLAGRQQRIIVTFNVGHFVPLLVRFTAEESGHSGCMLINSKTIAQNDFGAILKGIRAAIDTYPDQSDWHKRVVWLRRKV